MLCHARCAPGGLGGSGGSGRGGAGRGGSRWRNSGRRAVVLPARRLAGPLLWALGWVADCRTEAGKGLLLAGGGGARGRLAVLGIPGDSRGFPVPAGFGRAGGSLSLRRRRCGVIPGGPPGLAGREFACSRGGCGQAPAPSLLCLVVVVREGLVVASTMVLLLVALFCGALPCAGAPRRPVRHLPLVVVVVFP